MLYLIIGEALALLYLTRSPSSFVEASQGKPSAIPYVGTILMVIIWPVSLAGIVFFVARYFWRLR